MKLAANKQLHDCQGDLQGMLNDIVHGSAEFLAIAIVIRPEFKHFLQTIALRNPNLLL
jgi:hypothetical protein